MINKNSVDACDASRFGRFNKPLYDSYCFSRIPETVRTLLTGQKGASLPSDTYVDATYDTVLVILIDSFGWQYFEKFAPKYPFLQRFIDKGIVSKITSQFPSTTTNHMTCMHTALSVGLSGLYEWFYYEPLVDACICPLRFSFAKDKGYNTLAKAGFRSDELFNFRTVYQDFAELGVRSVVFQDKDSARSPYSQMMYQGAEIVGYKNLPEGLTRLTRAMLGLQKQPQQKSYFLFYYGDIDGAGHEFGPNSDQVAHQVDKCFSRLELFWQEIATKMQNTCVILTADHGMAQIRPESIWFINEHLPTFERFIKRNKQGELLVPCGSSRDMFLHIKEECLEEAYNELTHALSGIAEVHKTSELIKQGLFGPISQRFLDRVGNLVILPLGEGTVWWHEPGRFENPYHGHHGGLSRLELETIFLFQALS